MTDAHPQEFSPLDTRARVPQHVVYRDFVTETVVLNLQTGTYHGLNRTAGEMLKAVDHAESLRQAAEELAAEHGWDVEVIESDLLVLCTTLAEGGLLEFSGKASS